MPAVASSVRGEAGRSSAGCVLVKVPELRRRRSSYCTSMLAGDSSAPCQRIHTLLRRVTVSLTQPLSPNACLIHIIIAYVTVIISLAVL